ncbi:MAG: HAD family phosphatase [Bacteroidales bacterium]
MRNIKIKPLSGKKPDAIIFDLGGVLLNLDFKRSIDEFIAVGFRNIENELSRLLVSRPAGNDLSFFHLYETGRISSREFRDELRKHAGRDIPDKDIDRAWTAMLVDMHEENIRIIEKLKRLYRLFLLSNTNAIHIETLLDSKEKGEGFSRLTELFEKLYYSHEVKMRKPDREIFDHVLKDAGLKAENVLFIDDSVHNVEAARTAGLQAYHHKANTSLREVFEIR